MTCFSEQKFWDQFVDFSGMEELRPHMFARKEEKPELFDKVEAFFKSKTLAEWKEWIGDKDICTTYVMNKDEAVHYILDHDTGLMEICDFPLTGKTLRAPCARSGYCSDSEKRGLYGGRNQGHVRRRRMRLAPVSSLLKDSRFDRKKHNPTR